MSVGVGGTGVAVAIGGTTVGVAVDRTVVGVAVAGGGVVTVAVAGGLVGVAVAAAFVGVAVGGTLVGVAVEATDGLPCAQIPKSFRIHSPVHPGVARNATVCVPAGMGARNCPNSLLFAKPHMLGISANDWYGPPLKLACTEDSCPLKRR